MNIGVWITGIACVVVVSIIVGIRRMHTKSYSIGTSPLVDEVAVTTSTTK
jgi:hypothetical protein